VPVGIELVDSAYHGVTTRLHDRQAGRLRRRDVLESFSLTRLLFRRNVLCELRAATYASPTAALAPAARRHAGLVGIEAGFDGQLEIAKLGFDEARMQQPAHAVRACAHLKARAL
jgi:hypothetical protein